MGSEDRLHWFCGSRVNVMLSVLFEVLFRFFIRWLWHSFYFQHKTLGQACLRIYQIVSVLCFPILNRGSVEQIPSDDFSYRACPSSFCCRCQLLRYLKDWRDYFAYIYDTMSVMSWACWSVEKDGKNHMLAHILRTSIPRSLTRCESWIARKSVWVMMIRYFEWCLGS